MIAGTAKRHGRKELLGRNRWFDAATHLRHKRLDDSVKLGALVGEGAPAAAVNTFTAAAQRCNTPTRYTADEWGVKKGVLRL